MFGSESLPDRYASLYSHRVFMHYKRKQCETQCSKDIPSLGVVGITQCVLLLCYRICLENNKHITTV